MDPYAAWAAIVRLVGELDGGGLPAEEAAGRWFELLDQTGDLRTWLDNGGFTPWKA